MGYFFYPSVFLFSAKRGHLHTRTINLKIIQTSFFPTGALCKLMHTEALSEISQGSALNNRKFHATSNTPRRKIEYRVSNLQFAPKAFDNWLPTVS